MKRPLALLLALLLAAAPAGAGSWYVGANGVDTNSGKETTLPKTLAWFNTHCAAGDTCLMLAGVYPTRIEPRATGTPSSYIVYVGNVTTPSTITVTSVNIDSLLGATRCISVKGVTATGDLTLKTDSSYAAGYDSVTYCVFRGQLVIRGRDNCNVVNCTFGTGDNTDLLTITNNMPTGITAWSAANPTVHQKNWNAYRSRFVDSLYIADCTFNLATTGRQQTAAAWRGMNRSRLARCRFALAANATTDTHLNTWYDCSYNTISDCYFSGKVTSSSLPVTYLLNMRDNNVGNVFERDTLVQDVASVTPLKIGLNTAGNDRDIGQWPDSVRTYDFGDSNNVFSECVMRVGDIIEVQSKADNNRYLFNTLACSSLWLANYQPSQWPDSNACDSVVFRHNTVLASNPNGIAILGYESKLNHSVFSQNIIIAQYPHSPTATKGHYGFGKGSSFTSCDSNLVWCWEPSDSLFAVNLDFLSGGSACKVGPNSTWGTAVAGNPTLNLGYDKKSKWGDPTLADTTAADGTIDPRPNTYGLAYSSDWADGFVGAIALPADTTKPVVTITAPDQSRVWSKDELMTIGWTSTDAVGVTSHAIQWNAGPSPSTWRTVVSGLSGSATSYTWKLPTLTTEKTTFRVLAYDAAGNIGTASFTFDCNAVSGDDGGGRVEFPE